MLVGDIIEQMIIYISEIKCLERSCEFAYY